MEAEVGALKIVKGLVHILINVVMIVCGLVCAAASVFWVRSYSGTDLVQFVRVDDRPSAVTVRHLSAFSTRGRIGVGDRILSATQGGPWTLEQVRSVPRG